MHRAHAGAGASTRNAVAPDRRGPNLTNESQEGPQEGKCTIHVGDKRCTESADGASGLCFLHDPSLTLKQREEIAKNKGGGSLKVYIEYKLDKEESLNGVYLKGADLTHARLEGAELIGAHLEGACLLGAHLRNANLVSAQCERANLSQAHLEGADLGHAHLKHANLLRADLTDASLWDTDLKGARLSFAKLSETRHLSAKHLKQVHPDVEAYRSFKRAFVEMNRYDDASQAAFREKKQHRHALLLRIRTLWSLRRLEGWAWLACFGQWLVHGTLETLCGYFEKPLRPVRWSAIIVLVFALVYSHFDAFTPYPISGNTCVHQAEVGSPARDAAVAAPSKKATQRIGMSNAVYCSLVTFTTLGYGDFRPRAGGRPVAALEATIGAFMMALFVVTLSHRFVAR